MPRGKLTGYLALAAIVKPTCWLYVRASTALDSLPAGINACGEKGQDGGRL